MTADRNAPERLSPEPLFPSPRPEVESLHAYSAPLEGRRQMLRLDFNENTIGPSPKVVEALRAIPADHIAIYPEYDGLKEAVIANLGLPQRLQRLLGNHGADTVVGVDLQQQSAVDCKGQDVASFHATFAGFDAVL